MKIAAIGEVIKAIEDELGPSFHGIGNILVPFMHTYTVVNEVVTNMKTKYTTLMSK